ncbi:MAG: T9SS type A sorting domain-containing protein [Ignavibacteriaceae bacterium]
MSKFLRVFGLFFLLFLPSVFAQTLSDYVLSQSGDTLVIKDDTDYGSPNTLYSVLSIDTVAPADRVYELHNGGIYSLVNTPTTSSSQRAIIMGPIQTSIKLSQSTLPPPVLQGAVYQGGSSTGGINSGYDLLLKNIDIEEANSAGGEGFGFIGGSSGARIELDNSIVEHNLWTLFPNPGPFFRIFLKGDYFVNLDGYSCRRNGGILDFFANEDTIWVENCTHVNTQGSNYKTRPGYNVNKIFFNHNDWIDCSGFVFMNSGADHPNYSVTNNIFVNCQLQDFAPVLESADGGEVDPDSLPMGFVNIIVDSAFNATNLIGVAGGSFYADKNLVYWDASLSNIDSTLNAKKVDGETSWVSQRIIMNSRTAAAFADKKDNPKLTNGTWIQNELPKFVNTDVLFTTQLAILKTYSIACVDTSFTGTLTSWRQASNPESQYFDYPDWPIPINLSYTNSDLLTAGLGNFPLGDLSWFPTQYAQWSAQENTEIANINNTLATGVITAVSKTTELPQQFKLQQNYPNPFNPSTVISYTIPKSGNVTLKVYNILGQEVATLVNGYKTAQTYSVEFDGTKLSSGVYIYEIRYNNQSLTQKMMLMK